MKLIPFDLTPCGDSKYGMGFKFVPAGCGEEKSKNIFVVDLSAIARIFI